MKDGREQRHALDTGTFRDRRQGERLLRDYASQLIETRYRAGEIRATTADTQAGLWKVHIGPTFGAVKLNAITTPMVREWVAEVTARVSQVTAAKAYRCLSTILTTAIADGLIGSNPCTIRGAGVEKSPERPTATRDQAYALADVVAPHRRALVLKAAWCGLRLGECAGLQRSDVDALHGTVSVTKQVQRSKRQGGFYEAEPKTAGGSASIRCLVHSVTK